MPTEYEPEFEKDYQQTKQKASYSFSQIIKLLGDENILKTILYTMWLKGEKNGLKYARKTFMGL